MMKKKRKENMEASEGEASPSVEPGKGEGADDGSKVINGENTAADAEVSGGDSAADSSGYRNGATRKDNGGDDDMVGNECRGNGDGLNGNGSIGGGNSGAESISEENSEAENIGEESSEAESIIAELEAKLDEVGKQSREYLDRWQRSAAEFENYKRRTQNEMERLYVSSAIDVIAAFLPIVDSIERAVGPGAISGAENNLSGPGDSGSNAGIAEDAVVEGADADDSNNDSSDPYKDGLILIEKQLSDVLRKLGVTPLPGAGEQFDPNLHEAVMHIKDETYGSNVICEVFQKGYKYRDRIARHSVVKVAN